MKTKKTIWTTITEGFTSAAPILLSCCKSGACVGVCASPVASLFGVSSATIASSPLITVENKYLKNYKTFANQWNRLCGIIHRKCKTSGTLL